MKKLQIYLLTFTSILLVLITSCSQNSPSVILMEATESVVINTPLPAQPPISPTNSSQSLGLTYQQPDGSRVVYGKGGEEVNTVEIQLSSKPIWLVNVPYQEKSIWYVALEDGSGLAFDIVDQAVSQISLEMMNLPTGQPPVLVATADGVNLMPQPNDGASFSHPILINDGRMVYLAADGALMINLNEETIRLDVNALPDARILSDGTGRVLFLSGPTEIYPHGVLGDDVEASRSEEHRVWKECYL